MPGAVPLVRKRVHVHRRIQTASMINLGAAVGDTHETNNTSGSYNLRYQMGGGGEGEGEEQGFLTIHRSRSDYLPADTHGNCHRSRSPDRKSTRLNSSHVRISY